MYLLAMDLVELKNTTYAIFFGLGIQGCQIWHSHVSMPFNSAAAHSTRPYNAKKLFTLSFQPKFLNIRFPKFTGTSIKSYVSVFFLFFSWSGVPRGMFWATEGKRVTWGHFHEKWMRALKKMIILAPADFRNLFFVWKLWSFEAEIPVRVIFTIII